MKTTTTTAAAALLSDRSALRGIALAAAPTVLLALIALALALAPFASSIALFCGGFVATCGVLLVALYFVVHVGDTAVAAAPDAWRGAAENVGFAVGTAADALAVLMALWAGLGRMLLRKPAADDTADRAAAAAHSRYLASAALARAAFEAELLAAAAAHAAAAPQRAEKAAAAAAAWEAFTAPAAPTYGTRRFPLTVVPAAPSAPVTITSVVAPAAAVGTDVPLPVEPAAETVVTVAANKPVRRKPAPRKAADAPLTTADGCPLVCRDGWTAAARGGVQVPSYRPATAADRDGGAFLYVRRPDGGLIPSHRYAV